MYVLIQNSMNSMNEAPPKKAKKGLLFSLNEVKQLSYIHTTSHCSVPYVAPHLTFQFIFHFHPELTPIINFCLDPFFLRIQDAVC